MNLQQIKDLADLIERTPSSEIRRQGPRISETVALIRLNQEEKELVVKAIRYFAGFGVAPDAEPVCEPSSNRDKGLGE